MQSVARELAEFLTQSSFMVIVAVVCLGLLPIGWMSAMAGTSRLWREVLEAQSSRKEVPERVRRRYGWSMRTNRFMLVHWGLSCVMCGMFVWGVIEMRIAGQRLATIKRSTDSFYLLVSMLPCAHVFWTWYVVRALLFARAYFGSWLGPPEGDLEWDDRYRRRLGEGGD